MISTFYYSLKIAKNTDLILLNYSKSVLHSVSFVITVFDFIRSLKEDMGTKTKNKFICENLTPSNRSFSKQK